RRRHAGNAPLVAPGPPPLPELATGPAPITGCGPCPSLGSRPPARIVVTGPVLAHAAAHHAAQRMPRGGMDEREVQVPDEQGERRVEEPVVQEHRAREAERGVPLAEPEQEPRREEEDDERGVQDRVHLLSRVEAPGYERLELARRPQQAAAVAEERDERERRDP